MKSANMEIYKKQLESKIKETLSSRNGVTYFDVLQELGGADPREVYEIWKKFNPQISTYLPTTPSILGGTFPAPDFYLGQWWFTQSSIDWLMSYINQIIKPIAENKSSVSNPSAKICFDILAIGAPTITKAALDLHYKVGLLDIDGQVVKEANRIAKGFIENFKAKEYDVATPLPNQYKASANIVLSDPPWYQPTMDMFIKRSIEAVCSPGHILLTFPSRFTRPFVEEEKRALLKRLTTSGLQVKSYQPEQISYVVPHFESCAFMDIEGFVPIPWRKADFLHLLVDTDVTPEKLDIPDQSQPSQVSSYARSERSERIFRVFIKTSASPREKKEKIPIKDLNFIPAEELFKKNISRRKTEDDKINIWTSEHRGGFSTDINALECILNVWKNESKCKKDAVEELVQRDVNPVAAKSFVELIDQELELWRRFHYPHLRRDDREIEEKKQLTLSSLAAQESGKREHQSQSDTFRAEFQRDRDRILWSKSLRKLTNKTQLFPVEHSDQLRQRLTHSLEVMQLATTIGNTFGLNRDLIEVGALAHDIGHTPFGHAGEHALDQLLHSINSDIGFNHYEHGVDVVRYLEDAYQDPGGRGHLGLDLTSIVCECILKHTFCHVNGRWHPDRKTVWESSKHKHFIAEGNSHLEGQAIRIADKVSYLISDIEDGILLGAIRRRDILQCRLFHVVPIEFTQGDDDNLHSDFIYQRKNILKVLMEDIILASEARISRLDSPDCSRNLTEFTIDHSDEMITAVNEIWEKLQMGRLHTDARVLMANMRAARIIKELTVLFALFPNLIESRFTNAYERIQQESEYMKFYTQKAGEKNLIPEKMTDFLPLELLIGIRKSKEFETEYLIQAKDYVASLTDAEAKHLHYKFISSYSDK